MSAYMHGITDLTLGRQWLRDATALPPSSRGVRDAIQYYSQSSEIGRHMNIRVRINSKNYRANYRYRDRLRTVLRIPNDGQFWNVRWIRSFTVVALMCMTSGETATAFDLKKTLKDLMPCKYAAIRLCERPQQVNAAALWKCGATLAAAPQEEIGKRCVAVLKRYGAALN
jgi:hypothetical protein